MPVPKLRVSKGCTQKQDDFARAYIRLKNARAAYREAYDCERSSDATVSRRSKELLGHPLVHERIQELRAELDKMALLSIEQHLKDLETLRQKSIEAGNYNAAVNAEVARGKVSGLYIETQKVVGDPAVPVQHVLKVEGLADAVAAVKAKHQVVT